VTCTKKGLKTAYSSIIKLKQKNCQRKNCITSHLLRVRLVYHFPIKTKIEFSTFQIDLLWQIVVDTERLIVLTLRQMTFGRMTNWLQMFFYAMQSRPRHFGVDHLLDLDVVANQIIRSLK
jgi:hypothetical protein